MQNNVFAYHFAQVALIKKEIREFYKKQAISIVDEMKTNNRQKALETKSNFKNTKQNIKGWAF